MNEKPSFYSEMYDAGTARPPYKTYDEWFSGQNNARLAKKSQEAEAFFRRTGITFNVYGQTDAEERLIPFDLVPRILSSREWTRLSKGIEQRVYAINAFLHDIYNRQEILRAGVIPVDLIARNDAFLPQMMGFSPPGDVYTHIVGTDIVRTGEDDFFVLEDNARTPSGVSYMLENRETMLQMFPELFSAIKVQPVSDYPKNLRRSLEASAPSSCSGRPCVVILTPGIHNSAYFEHSFLADQMGVELVEGHDLKVVDGRIAMRTTKGYKTIDVIYRRVDDEYLDPLTFNPVSMLGIPGIMDVYRAGNITIANAPGTGVADDKAVYSYLPDIVRFYTGEPAILKNVETYRCSEADSLKYVLDNLSELVVKEVHGSGDTGCLSGPRPASRNWRISRPSCVPDPRITSRSRHWRCLPCRSLQKAVWRRDMWIFGPSRWFRRKGSISRRAG